MRDQLHLLKTKRFLPLFLTQFLGAFNDNVFKNALVILITYATAAELGLDPRILVTAAAGIFILPFFLFSAVAGQLADSFEKSVLIRRLKCVEILLMMLAAAGFYLQEIYYLLGVLFLMGVQSSFFGPLKYGILPDHLQRDELVAGNALVEASTFVAILVGTIIGGYFILKDGGLFIITSFVIFVACLGLFASLFIPKAERKRKRTTINWNIFSASWHILKYAKEHKDLFTAVLGISWFWLVGFVFLAQLPVFGKNVLGADENVVTLFLTCFSVGVGIGSLFCNSLLKGAVRMHLAPYGAFGMAFFTFIMCALSPDALDHQTFIGISEYLSSYTGGMVLAAMVMIAACGGIYVVPLYAVLQDRSTDGFQSRMIAANNIMNALFMVLASIATLVLLKVVPDITDIFMMLGSANILVAFLFWRRHR